MTPQAGHGVAGSAAAEASEHDSMDVSVHGIAVGSWVGMKGTTAGDSVGREASSAPWAAGSMQDSRDADSSEEEEDGHRAFHASLDEAAWAYAAHPHRAFAGSFFDRKQEWQVGDCLSTSTRTTWEVASNAFALDVGG